MHERLSIAIFVVTFANLFLILELVRRRYLREKYAFLWLAVGLAIVSLSLARPLLDRFSLAIGITYGPTTLFLFSIMFLAGVAAHLSYEVSRLEEKTRKLAEEIALMKVERPATESGVTHTGA